MKQINKYILEHFENSKFSILERLHITKDTGDYYNYHPKDRYELKELIDKLIKERGNNADLNDIDTSEISDMSKLFYRSVFNGNISNWNVSNVENMEAMFRSSEFTSEKGDISKWDVSNVKDMTSMFGGCGYLQCDLSNWDVGNVKDMYGMFAGCDFTGENGDISNWDVSNVTNMYAMFYNSKFNGDISKWNVSNVKYMNDMFKDSPLEKNPPKWYKK